MREIILNLCTSLDSYIEGPNGEFDWCFTDQDYSMTAFLDRIDTIFLGRKSYEQLERDAPDAFSNKKKIVFSNSLKNEDNDLQIISSDIEKEVKEIMLDPYLETADTDTGNNYFPPRQEQSKFELFKSRRFGRGQSAGENPMQRANRAKAKMKEGSN